MNAEVASDVVSPEQERQAREWASYLHFSVLLGLIAPMVGLVAPIIIWQMKKDQYPIVDVHGKIVMNWIISFVIYCAISFVLLFVLIGIPLMIALGVMGIVFPIMGGMKANRGEVWKYPLSLRFLR